jgi:hypothetical protein
MFVQRGNGRLIIKAAKSNAIVSSMFPSNIRDKLICNDEDTIQKSKAQFQDFHGHQCKQWTY